jgi:hypothetical protein
MRRRLTVVLVVLASVGTACSASGDGGRELVVQPEPAERSEHALFQGHVRYDAVRGCVYLEPEEGGGRLLPVWPHGWEAEGTEPVRILDDAGRLVVRSGKRMRSGGGYHGVPEGAAACGVRAATDAAFVVGELERRGGAPG